MKNWAAKNKWLLAIALLLFLVPFLFWGRSTNVGGDDTKLYYLFPWQYIRNIALNLGANNWWQGYVSQSHYLGLSVVVLIFKKIFFFLNTQHLLYGLNLGLGFLAFYYFLSIWIEDERPTDKWAKIIASLFYVLSTFAFLSFIWKEQLMCLFLVAVFPLFALFIFRGIIQNRPTLIVLAALLVSLFSVVLMPPPWFLALVLVLLPILVWLFLQNKKSFLLYFFLLAVLLLLLNLHWLFHLFFASYENNGNSFVASVVDPNFRQKNIEMIQSVTKDNEVLYPLFNLFHKQLQVENHWSTANLFIKWNWRLLPFMLFPLLVLIYPFFNLSKIKLGLRNFYLFAFLSWLLSLFFFTVRIGRWGLPAFLWLNDNIPGFTMFRNMYDKFGLAMAFTFALTLAIGLKVYFDNPFFSRIKNRYIISFFVLIALLNGVPFILGLYGNQPLSSTTDTYSKITDFNSDFYALTDYIKEDKSSSNYLWLPLSNTGYVAIQDSKLPNHYYYGGSPLMLLTGHSDYSGKFSFNKRDSDQLFTYFEKDQYQEAGDYLKRFNIGYIIVNNSISDDLKTSDMYRYGTYDLQQKGLYNALQGRKIQDFGSRYSLYEIKPEFKSSKLSSDKEHLVSFSKESMTKYTFNLIQPVQGEKLTFLSPFDKGWRLYQNGREVKADHLSEYGNQANVWQLGEGTKSGQFTLYFKPEIYFFITLAISGGTFVLCILYLIFTLKKPKIK